MSGVEGEGGKLVCNERLMDGRRRVWCEDKESGSYPNWTNEGLGRIIQPSLPGDLESERQPGGGEGEFGTMYGRKDHLTAQHVRGGTREERDVEASLEHGRDGGDG